MTCSIATTLTALPVYVSLFKLRQCLNPARWPPMRRSRRKPCMMRWITTQLQKRWVFYLFSNLISIDRHLSQRPRVRKKHHHLQRDRMKMAKARYIRTDESFLPPFILFLKPVWMIQMKILLAVALAVIVLLLFAVGGGVGLLLKSNFMDSGKSLILHPSNFVNIGIFKHLKWQMCLVASLIFESSRWFCCGRQCHDQLYLSLSFRMLRELVNEYVSQLTATLVLGGAGHLVICRQELAGSEARIGPGEDVFVTSFEL